MGKTTNELCCTTDVCLHQSANQLYNNHKIAKLVLFSTARTLNKIKVNKTKQVSNHHGHPVETVMGTYAAVSRNYGGSSPSCDAEWFLDENYEPTAADHSPDVLYEIGKSPVVGRFMVAARDIEAGEVIFNDEPACIGECVRR